MYDKYDRTFALEIAFLVEWPFILILIVALSPFEYTLLFLPSDVLALIRMSLALLTPQPLNFVIDYVAVVGEFWWPVESFIIVGHIILHSTLIIRSIIFNVMSLAIGDTANEFADEDSTIFVVHFTKSVRTTFLEFMINSSTSSILPS